MSGQGIAVASRFLVARDLDAGRLIQVVDGAFKGRDDFYLLARTSGQGSQRWMWCVNGFCPGVIRSGECRQKVFESVQTAEKQLWLRNESIAADFYINETN